MIQLPTVLAFFALSIIKFVVKPLAFPIVPIAVLFANSEGRLPRCFRWYETPDALGWGAGTYEPPIQKAYDRYGKRIALIFWLWRNRAYGFSTVWRCDPNYNTMILRSYGTQGVFKNAPAVWLGTITDGDRWWFEFSFAIPVGNLFVIGMRNGWKLLPFFVGHRPDDFSTTATGLFTGITVRTDSPDGE